MAGYRVRPGKLAALLLSALLVMPLARAASSASAGSGLLIDDFAAEGLVSPLGTAWRSVTDQVMGGISQARVTRSLIEGRPCLRLTGEVRLENNGGFIQAGLDLAPEGGLLDASAFTGLRLLVSGNDEDYSVHLRTPDNRRPWQSYRAQFTAEAGLKTVDLPFAAFAPHRLEEPLDLKRLKRIGLVAIGRAFQADLLVCELRLYK